MADQGNITSAAPGELDAAARQYAASQGWAMPDGSYPIRPANMRGREDLEAAIRAVGRGGASHDAIRAHIIKRAKAIGLGDLIPDNWAADGSLTGQNSLEGTVEIERRYTSGDTGKAELRADNGAKRIGGYAAVFNRQSKNLGGFIEVVDPVAFNQSRGDGWPDVIARYNHDDNQLLGTTAAGTLRMGIDAYGLSYDVLPPAAMAHVVELVERGDVRKSSFAFRTLDDDWTMTDQGYPLRRLTGAQVVDVAPVNTPAYADTSAGLRSLAKKFDADLEEVRSLAQADELRKFFVRTDGPAPQRKPKKGMFGPAAAAALLARREDPYV
ncbi:MULTISPECIES: HK97 family phage prohead protease [unclassified Streptomyces]|uniref:HK97 family phage prohead protease n=1 Tax=unclassified Streptomyces TaxID=2593676 RepID=UPI000FFE8618|nr:MULTISPECIES: HK97 family phage prohead protease [unclassified Streptomyces]